ncbi:hypothetical protein [Escherichia coli]
MASAAVFTICGDTTYYWKNTDVLPRTDGLRGRLALLPFPFISKPSSPD